MVNLVIVSHSARLGEGVGELTRQMLMGNGCKLAIAAGIDDPENPIGTDPIKVMEAIESVADAAKVRLCAAPLVEGTLAATVSAAAGGDIDKVINDAMSALEAKRVQLGLPSQPQSETGATAVSPDHDAHSVAVVIKNPNGLHVRPASRLVTALAGWNARLMLEKDGKCVTPDSINQIALLQVRCNDTLRLLASGPDADAALAAFSALVAENFGEQVDAAPQAAPSPAAARVQGNAVSFPFPSAPPDLRNGENAVNEQQRLQQAIAQTLLDLNVLAALAEKKCSPEIAAIFSGHHTLLDDAGLYDAACDILCSQQCNVEWAWYQVMSELSQQYRQLDDGYLQARYIDIEDILHQTLRHLQNSNVTLPVFHAPAIILAEDIFPSTVLQLDAQQVKGICLQGGSDVSHGAIIARELGIAFLCQQGDALDAIQPGEALTVDIVGRRIIRG